MRKARSSRPGQRDDPLGAAYDAPPSSAPDGDDSSLHLLELTEAVDPSQREEAFDTIASLLTHTPEHVVERFMRARVSARLASGLSDSAGAVRAAAATATRVLCESGGDAVCDALVAQDLLTPLLALFVKMRVNVALAPEVATPFFAILAPVVAALRELCLRSDAAVALMQPHAIALLAYLDPAAAVPLDVRCSAAHTLLSVVEDAPSPLSLDLTPLHAHATSPPLLRALCAALLLALHAHDAAHCYATLAPIVALPLAEALTALEPDMRAAAAEALAASNEAQEAMEAEDQRVKEGEAEYDLPSVPRNNGPAMSALQESLQQWMRTAQGQQVALETLSNVFASVEPPNVDAACVQIALSCLEPVQRIATVSLTALDARWGEQLLMALPALDGCMEQLQQLQLRALSCLTNVLIACSDNGILSPQKDTLCAMWNSMMALLETTSSELIAFSKKAPAGTQPGGDELLDAICHVIWSLARCMAPVLPIAPNHVNGILSIIEHNLTPMAQAALCGTLGCLAPLLRTDAALCQRATAALVRVAADPSLPHTLAAAEALCATVELYADDGTHATFQGLQVGPALAQRLQSGRAFLGGTMALSAEVEGDRERLEEVLGNVEAFLQYKSGA